MRINHSFKTLAFRVHIKPAPRTQSESNAVLRYLQELGPISTFQIPHPSPVQRTTKHDTVGDSAIANLVFAHNTKSVDGLRNGRTTQEFAVVANANIPDARVKDPFNIQGLQNRKPELQPREFQCRITPTANESGYVLEGVSDNEYRNAFAVDRSSIFGEILAKTDCPSGLIHGLLPKLEDKHRMQAHGLSSRKTQNDYTSEKGKASALKGPATQQDRRKTQFIPLDLDHLTKEDSLAATDYTTETSQPNFHDEFAALRGVSLMRMYRDATARTNASQAKSSTRIAPVPDPC